MKLKTILLATVTAVAVFFTHLSSAEPATEKTIRLLLETTGSGTLGKQMIQQLLPAMKIMAPNATEEFWVEFMKEVNPDDIIALSVPVYQKHFSEEDLLETIAFYKTPAGQRLIAKLPTVVQESTLVGQQWGQELAKRTIERAQKQKIEITK
jgi:uncharacterized protein